MRWPIDSLNHLRFIKMIYARRSREKGLAFLFLLLEDFIDNHERPLAFWLI
jgi:hypothetical protein